MVGLKEYWYGKEVEGRLYGIATMFVDDIYSDWETAVGDCPHIYFTSNAVQQLVVKNDWHKSFYRPYQVTLEVSKYNIENIPAWIRINVHLFYAIEEEREISHLKDTDSVKIIKADYDLYATTIFNMQEVKPKDYANDREEKL